MPHHIYKKAITLLQLNHQVLSYRSHSFTVEWLFLWHCYLWNYLDLTTHLKTPQIKVQKWVHNQKHQRKIRYSDTCIWRKTCKEGACRWCSSKIAQYDGSIHNTIINVWFVSFFGKWENRCILTASYRTLHWYSLVLVLSSNTETISCVRAQWRIWAHS